MSKQLSAEWERRISDEALAYSKDMHDRNDYEAGVIAGSECGFIEAATVYATQLVEAQERVKTLEDALQTIATECPGDARQLANEALSPNNKLKEDE